jgi:acetyl esterase/lipase
MAVVPELVRVDEGVVFASWVEGDLRCDVLSPAQNSGGAPALLLLAGGGSHDNRRALRPYATQYAELGFVCVCPEYRLVTASPSWPLPLDDVKAVIRWVRATSADLGVDADKIALQGHSAGALFALLAAGTARAAPHPDADTDGTREQVSERVAAVVAFYPGTDFTRGGGGQLTAALFGERGSAEQLRLASPIAHVDAEFPPTLLLHGTGDRAAPHGESVRMFEQLEAAGVPVEQHLFAGQEHGFDVDRRLRQMCIEIAHLFLTRYLGIDLAVRPAEE